MELDGFSLAKRFVHLGENRIAYHDSGSGPPVALLHGCPFSGFVWRNVIPTLASAGHRCLAPVLWWLGDTETAADTDWSLPAQADMAIGWMDALGIKGATVVGHDHGAAAQLLAAEALVEFLADPDPARAGAPL